MHMAGVAQKVAFIDWFAFPPLIVRYAALNTLKRVFHSFRQSRRHTSFAQVRVFPVARSGTRNDASFFIKCPRSWPGAKEIHISSKDLRIDTFRASGPGGQVCIPEWWCTVTTNDWCMFVSTWTKQKVPFVSRTYPRTLWSNVSQTVHSIGTRTLRWICWKRGWCSCIYWLSMRMCQTTENDTHDFNRNDERKKYTEGLGDNAWGSQVCQY